jgi:hypothetical protein
MDQSLARSHPNAAPDESNTGRMIDGESCGPYGQCEKRDQAAAISIGHHAAVRATVRRLRVERGKANTRGFCRVSDAMLVGPAD